MQLADTRLMQSPPGTQETALTREMPPVDVAETSPLPPSPTLISAAGDACANCGALVAADQRYCIECGERRGQPRLPFMDGRTAAEPPAEVVPSQYTQMAYPPPAPPKSKWSSGLALLATIGLLLLAMGVGVLIGNDGDDKAVAQQPVVIGGPASTATGASGATAAAAGAGAAAADSASKDKAGVDADAVAKKNGVKLAPKDVDLGGKCEKGSVGCSDSGEFDGEYFK
jgi:hypothetical protein